MNKYKTYFIDTNYSTLRYISLICMGFSFYFFITDLFLTNYIKKDLFDIYKKLDLFFLVLTLFSLIFCWTSIIQKSTPKSIFNFLIPLLYVNWAAIITGIDFEIFGLSTFIITILFCTFFLYFNILQSLVLFFSSVITLFFTIYSTSKNVTQLFPIIMILGPTAIFCILMTSRNYKNKIKELVQQDKIVEMNNSLMKVNETLEEEVKLRTRQIQIALDKAKESDRLKTAFLRNMSHEIHTPLNALEGFSKLIIRQDLPLEKIKKYSEFIQQSSEKIIQIISDIILISEIHSKQVVVYESKFDAMNVLEDIVNQVKEKAGKKGLDIQLLKGSTIDSCLITSDEKKMRTILTHLIDNAIKFSNKGTIEILFEQQSNWVHFTIKDSGIGISDEMSKSIFYPFRQQENELHKSPGGNGLGLAIVKSCTDLLHGKIDFTSEVNVGSTFKVSFPMNMN